METVKFPDGKVLIMIASDNAIGEVTRFIDDNNPDKLNTDCWFGAQSTSPERLKELLFE